MMTGASVPSSNERRTEGSVHTRLSHARHVAQHRKDHGVVPSSARGTGPFG